MLKTTIGNRNQIANYIGNKLQYTNLFDSVNFKKDRFLFFGSGHLYNTRIPVFGMLKQGDKGHVQLVKNCSTSQLIPIIKGKADMGAIIYADGFKTYDGLADFGYKKHYRVKHGENEYNHINGIENFWRLCKVRLARFCGVHKHTFYLHT